VYKRQPIGAGIILAPNAMQIYNHLGLQNQLANIANPIDRMFITDRHLCPITSLDIRPLLDKHSWQNLAIHRADLHRILLQEVGEENVIFRKKLSLLRHNSTTTHLLFEDGTAIDHRVVIGADGVNSRVRDFVATPMRPRPTNQMCWRGVLEYALPSDVQNQSYEAWHNGMRFGYVQINSREVYWYFVCLNEHRIMTETIAESLLNFFPLAKKIVELTSHSNIFQSALADIKPFKNWSRGNSCLIGDAAHATTPNLGQGACQAIEDAYLLGNLLIKHSNQTALQLFPKLRQNRVNSIVNTSRQIGWISHWQHATAQTLRNASMRLVPSWATLRHFEKLYRVPFLKNLNP
jgi:2-polyprenyl-6-methoxyphenol hydroxylase-like FAD-dependent oxidoreductase